MAIFKPCQGKNACRDDGVLCLTCGRRLVEIHSLRELLQQLTELAVDYDYENVEEYTVYVTRKLEKMILSRRQEQVGQ
jgi:hypothetical protein